MVVISGHTNDTHMVALHVVLCVLLVCVFIYIAALVTHDDDTAAITAPTASSNPDTNRKIKQLQQENTKLRQEQNELIKQNQQNHNELRNLRYRDTALMVVFVLAVGLVMMKLRSKRKEMEGLRGTLRSKGKEMKDLHDTLRSKGEQHVVDQKAAENKIEELEKLLAAKQKELEGKQRSVAAPAADADEFFDAHEYPQERVEEIKAMRKEIALLTKLVAVLKKQVKQEKQVASGGAGASGGKLEEALQAQVDLLKRQISKMGEIPAENIPLEELKKAMKTATEKAMEGDETAMAELERLNKALEMNADYEKEQEAAAVAWDKAQKAANEEAYRRMRALVPLDLAPVDNLVAAGLPKPLARRMHVRNQLRLLVTPPAQIKNTHAADLFTRFHPQGLDLVVMRAIYTVLPDEFEADGDGRKAQWLAAFKQKLKGLVKQEASKKEGASREPWERHSAYKEIEKRLGWDPSLTVPMPEGPEAFVFDPDAPLADQKALRSSAFDATERPYVAKAAGGNSMQETQELAAKKAKAAGGNSMQETQELAAKKAKAAGGKPKKAARDQKQAKAAGAGKPNLMQAMQAAFAAKEAARDAAGAGKPNPTQAKAAGGPMLAELAAKAAARRQAARQAASERKKIKNS